MSLTQAVKGHMTGCLAWFKDKLSPSQWETVSLLTHWDQASALFASLEEERQGYLVSFDSAFDDV